MVVNAKQIMLSRASDGQGRFFVYFAVIIKPHGQGLITDHYFAASLAAFNLNITSN
jgi:hypothetical protein